MKISLSAAFVFLVMALASMPAASDDTPSAQPKMRCEQGPVHRTFGNTQWLVYSCADEQTLIIVTDKDNPAAPFYFMFAPREDGYHLKGEGAGLKSAASDAFKQLKTLSKQDITNLLAATKTPDGPN